MSGRDVQADLDRCATHLIVPARDNHLRIVEHQRGSDVHGVIRAQPVSFGEVACQRDDRGEQLDEIQAGEARLQVPPSFGEDSARETTISSHASERGARLDVDETRAPDGVGVRPERRSVDRLGLPQEQLDERRGVDVDVQ